MLREHRFQFIVVSILLISISIYALNNMNYRLKDHTIICSDIDSHIKTELSDNFYEELSKQEKYLDYLKFIDKKGLNIPISMRSIDFFLSLKDQSNKISYIRERCQHL